MVLDPASKAKRLLRRLSLYQFQDEVITSYMTAKTRYCLLNGTSSCAQVTVNWDDNDDSPSPSSSLEIHDLPRFLASQLEAQQMTDDSSDLWHKYAPLFDFISSSLRDLSEHLGYPTVFSWYCKENHRKFVVFAFVNIKMSSKTYTAAELLHIGKGPRSKHVANSMHKKLGGNSHLFDIIRLPRDRHLRRPTDIGSSTNEERPAHQSGASQLDGTDSSEWAHRGRAVSQAPGNQPIPAPAGLDAQKDEGFQRFYKAVVSPTHVRVTAGGRIVPNPRGASSPTRGMGDGQNRAAEPTPFPVHQAPVAGFASMVHGYAPAMAPAIFPGHIVPIPMSFSVPAGYSLATPQLHRLPSVQSLANPPQPSLNSEAQTEPASDNAKPALKISPPSQFDHNRPYFYNGQWVYPQGNQFYSYGIVQSPTFPAHTMQPPNSAPLLPMGHSFAPRMIIPASIPAPIAAATMPSVPQSSIRPSEITRRQLASLKTSLRWHEDQLQFNKHQIDEKTTQFQAQQIRLQIQDFERNLAAQVAYEDGSYAGVEKRSEETQSSANHDVQEPPKSSTIGVSREESSDQQVQGEGELTPRPNRKTKPVKSRSGHSLCVGLNTSKSTVGYATARAFRKMSEQEVEEPIRKPSTLPRTAALAPPFEPRAERSGGASLRSNHAASSDEPTTSSYEEPVYVHTSQYVAQSTASTWKSFFKNRDCPHDYGNPYLVGSLPLGVAPETARDIDYIYGRELTDAELRARHMYWGKAPRHLQRGLPKFDGRSFYPPSPVKDRSAESASSSNLGGRQIPIGGNEVDYGLSGSRAESDPFQTLIQADRSVRRNHFGDVTQSEALPRPGNSSSGNESDTPSYRTQFGSDYYETPEVSPDVKSSSEEDSNLLFHGRRSNAPDSKGSKYYNDIWQSMLKRGGMASANVAPNKVSSTTAQGVLPNYAGHATASLTPTMANTAATPPRGRTMKKFADVVNVRSGSPIAEKRGENRPPHVVRRDDSSNRRV